MKEEIFIDEETLTKEELAEHMQAEEYEQTAIDFVLGGDKNGQTEE